MFVSNHLKRLDFSLLAIAVVTILSDVKDKPYSFTDEKTGQLREGSTRRQAAKLEVNGFAYPFAVRLEDGQAPWAKGDYTLDLAAMLQVNKEAISLSKYPVLVPMKAAVSA